MSITTLGEDDRVKTMACSPDASAGAIGDRCVTEDVFFSGIGVHVVFEAKGFEVVVETEFAVIDKVKILFLVALSKGRMVDDSDAASDKLVELAEAAVRPHGHDNADRGQVIALAEHLQLNDRL